MQNELLLYDKIIKTKTSLARATKCFYNSGFYFFLILLYFEDDLLPASHNLVVMLMKIKFLFSTKKKKRVNQMTLIYFCIVQ